MSEKAYKTMTNTGAGSLALGIILLVTGLAACGAKEDGNNSGDAGRISAEDVVEDNKASGDDAAANAEDTGTTRTEYPLTITSYGPDGEEYTATYEKAP